MEVNQIQRGWKRRGEIKTRKIADMVGSAGGKSRPKGTDLACSPCSLVKGLRVMETH